MSDGVQQPRPLTLTVKVYFATVIAAGVTFVGLSLWQIREHPPGYQWYMLAALTLISGSATVRLPSVGILISVSETFVFFAVLLFGPAAGTVMVALDALVMSFWVARRRPEWYRPLFNMAAPAVSFWIASHVLFAMAGIGPLLNQPTSANQLVLPLATCAVVYFALNSWLITFPTAFHRGLSPFRVWWDSSLLLSLSYFFGAALALLLVLYTREVNVTFIGVIIPLLLVSYLTYKTTVGRMEDANRHLEQVNRLYLSTIETLAMAIDAKDQVTHGHIRRVQVFAVNLARAIGIRDNKLIKAIEAAALLHDMGKLAVPEYILNKPGKLTEAEFERMKMHASIGAEILSAIDFPYPVVPIVRHHHENWDGTGYPDGLRGTNIPIGARILSVVDCFDALTSDRPYRPRLRDEDALRILHERRGAMYDPLIVDTFTRVYRSIAPDRESALPERALEEIAIARRTSAPVTTEPVLDEISASADEMLTLFDLSRSIAGQVSITDVVETITNHLRRLIPGTLFVFYIVDQRSGHVEARYSIGVGSDVVRGLRIPVGQRLSGWVAAHRQTIVNSDPVLDLGSVSRGGINELKSCVSVPLCADTDVALGALTVYSNRATAFTEDHRRILEAVACQVAETVRRATGFDATSRLDTATAPLNEAHNEAALTAGVGCDDSPFAVMFVNISNLRILHQTHGREAADLVLRHVVQHIQRMLRIGDVLLRHSSDDFVVLLNGAEMHIAAGVEKRIHKEFLGHPVLIPNGASVDVSVTVGVACAPTEARTLDQLLALARRRASNVATNDSFVH